MKKEIMIGVVVNAIFFVLISIANYNFITLDVTPYITKTIASVLFVLCGVFNLLYALFCKREANKKFSLIMVIGLVFAAAGDILLIDFFPIGAAAFAVGHIFYFVAATLIAISLNDVYSYNYSTVTMLISLGVSIVLSTTIMLLSKPLKLNFGKFFFQTLAYTLILTFMSAYSIILAIAVPSLWPFATGICMIFVSDLVLSTQYFGGQQDNKLLIILNHLIYYVGQIFIAISLFM